MITKNHGSYLQNLPDIFCRKLSVNYFMLFFLLCYLKGAKRRIHKHKVNVISMFLKIQT